MNFTTPTATDEQLSRIDRDLVALLTPKPRTSTPWTASDTIRVPITIDAMSYEQQRARARAQWGIQGTDLIRSWDYRPSASGQDAPAASVAFWAKGHGKAVAR